MSSLSSSQTSSQSESLCPSSHLTVHQKQTLLQEFTDFSQQESRVLYTDLLNFTVLYNSLCEIIAQYCELELHIEYADCQCVKTIHFEQFRVCQYIQRTYYLEQDLPRVTFEDIFYHNGEKNGSFYSPVKHPFYTNLKDKIFFNDMIHGKYNVDLDVDGLEELRSKFIIHHSSIERSTSYLDVKNFSVKFKYYNKEDDESQMDHKNQENYRENQLSQQNHDNQESHDNQENRQSQENHDNQEDHKKQSKFYNELLRQKQNSPTNKHL